MAESTGVVNTLEHGKVGGVPVWGIGVALAGGIVLYSFIKNRNAAKNAAASANTQATDNTNSTGTFDENAIDPSTGLTYAQESAAGYGLPAGPLGDWLSQNPTSSAYPVGLNEQGLPGPVTNQQWGRLAADSLIAKGDDPTLVENALADYFAGKTLSSAEQSIVNLALEMFGSPPEGITNVGTNPSPTPGQAPSSPHLTVNTANTTNHSIELHWNAVSGATQYVVGLSGPNPPGPPTLTGSTIFVNQTSGTIGNLQPGRKYYFNIRATNDAGSSPGSNLVSETTKSR